MLAELGYWVAHALIAVAALVLFKILAASKAGEAVPGLRSLAAVA